MVAGLVLAGAITDIGENKSIMGSATADRGSLARPAATLKDSEQHA
jgi:hypothetical protein